MQTPGPLPCPLPCPSPRAVPSDAQAGIDIDQLFRAHRWHVQAFVSRYVGDAADAEDVTQVTFMEAARCASQFTGLSKPSTWLFGIALNMARNHVRQRRNALDTEELDFHAEILGADHADPATQFERRDRLDKALAMVSRMSSELQYTFHAVLDSGQTYEGAAQALGIPVGTVRSRLSRIRDHLRCLEAHSAGRPMRAQ